MGKREQELIDQMRRWRAEIDARPDLPWPSGPQPAPRRVPTPRDERLEAARARRQARLSAPLNIERFPVYRDINGVTVIYGPQPLLEAAYQAGEPVRVLGSNGALYPVKVEKVCRADKTGRCVAWPAGTAADRNNLERLGTADRDEIDGGDTLIWMSRKAKRRHGRSRGGRAR